MDGLYCDDRCVIGLSCDWELDGFLCERQADEGLPFCLPEDFEAEEF